MFRVKRMGMVFSVHRYVRISMHCICYVANEGYLFQTLLSAIQARARTTISQCDIIILDMTAQEGRESRIIAEICQMESIIYAWHDPRILNGLHISAARLLLYTMLPPVYTEILYLDEDIQIVGDLDPSLLLNPGPGKIAGARDIMVYLEKLGVPRPEWQANKTNTGTAYVNAGVLRVNRAEWADIGKAALDVIEKGGPLSFFDQDAINKVMGSNIDHVSMAWNFPGFMLNSGIEHKIPPVVVHFMSNPRPWEGSYLPWGRTWHLPYLELMKRYPALVPYRKKLSPYYFLGYKAKQAIGYVRDGTWRSSELANEIMALEKSVVA